MEYRIVDLEEGNLDEFDLFCHKSRRKQAGYRAKESWVRERFGEGLRIKLLQADEGRGWTSRGFVEYAPGEVAWRGIEADGYLVIHCIWVVGRHKGRGQGSRLLQYVLDDAESTNGVAVVTAEKKWLPGTKLFVKHGFEKVDEVAPNFALYVKRFNGNAVMPRFAPRTGVEGDGLVIMKSDQCPYLVDAVERTRQLADQLGIPLEVRPITTAAEAQSGFYPYGTFCIFRDGEVLTHHYQSDARLREMLAD